MKLDVKFSESNQSFDSQLSENNGDFELNFRGVQTIHGKDGNDGESAYEIALKHGFQGTESEWLDSLHGKNGVDGKDGIDGKDGYTPKKGVDYFDGRDGIDGKNGIDGKDGYTPVKGVDYRDGIDGIDGVDGKDGQDGYTPIKGTDYFTASDKVEMVNAVKEQLIVEQWTFTLEDGSVVTKDVVVE